MSKHIVHEIRCELCSKPKKVGTPETWKNGDWKSIISTANIPHTCALEFHFCCQWCYDQWLRWHMKDEST